MDAVNRSALWQILFDYHLQLSSSCLQCPFYRTLPALASTLPAYSGDSFEG